MPAPSTITLLLVGVLVVALAIYLTVIAYLLNKASFNLGTVLIGVRSIEHATTPLEDVVMGIGDDVNAIEEALGGLVRSEDDQHSVASG